MSISTHSDPINIFYADDDQDDRELVKETVENSISHAKLFEFCNGLELIDALLHEVNGIPDLILLDLYMPIKSGLETLRELKYHPKWKHIPVVIFTVDSDEESIRSAFNLHANAYVSKPGKDSTELATFMQALGMLWGRRFLSGSRPDANRNQDNIFSQTNILLVEDDADDIELTYSEFKRCNLANRLMVVRDGEQALDYLYGKGTYSDRDNYPAPDLMLIDLVLPQVSGVELIERVKADNALRHIPIIALTANQDAGLHKRAKLSGAVAVQNKPISLNTLASVIGVIGGFHLSIVKKSP